MVLFSACAACTPVKTRAALESHVHAPLITAPPPVDPQLVTMTAEPTTTLVAANATSELGIRVRIVAKDLPAAQRPPLDLALVLDTSGSMEGKPIDALRASARELAGKLRDGDRISVVVFHSKAEVLVPNVVVGPRNRATIERAIAGIHATGTTALVDGLSLGLAQLQRGIMPNGINRIVLFSDGVPNTSAQLPAMIAGIHQAGVSVTSLGFGVDYDTALMTQIARDTGGSFHYLEQPEEVAAVFDAELSKMTTAVARNVQLVIEPGPGVTIPAMPGLVAGGDGRVYATLGDLPAGETRDLMLPLAVVARGDGSVAELAQATLTFEDVIGHSGTRQRDAFVAAKASRDAAQVKAAIKIELEVARIRASAAAAILQAINLARAGQVQAARQGLAAATATVKAAAAKYKDPELDQLLRQLDQVGKEIAQIVPSPQLVAPPGRDMPGHAMPAPAPATAPTAEVESQLRRVEERATATVRGQH